jgi:DNA-binding response OmpR family regulator
VPTERLQTKPGAMRILVVEDEALIALELMETLSSHGFAPIGPARSASEALAILARERCDAAVLDVTLGHETAEPVARALYAKRVPFVVASGYEQSQLAPELRVAPFLRKPVDAQALLSELRALLKLPAA